MKIRMPIVVFVLILTTFVSLCAGQSVKSLPADLLGELEGVPYRILVPENWNGTLLVYAHGYGESGPPLAPKAADVDALLAEGYAMAASNFAGTGWTVKEGMQNTAALTAAFRGMIGNPKTTILWGKSMGGLMALGMIEKFPGLYDGAVAICPPAAGTPRRFDQGLDITIAYAVAFGWDMAWGTPGDLRDDLDFSTEVAPIVKGQLTDDRWEFIRRVNGIPPDSYVPANRALSLYFAMGVRAELESRAGGPVAENIGRVYTLTQQDKEALAAMGISAGLLLDQMNLMKYAAERSARNYASRYVNPSGLLDRPVITMHTEGDPVATPSNEGAYRATVEQQGNEDLLLQQFVPKGAHCTFTSAQELAGIDAMVEWLKTGIRPDPAIFFPTTLGFDPFYVPPPWPW